MATTSKRKPRNVMAKKELDLTKPIPLDILGSEDDPCFGKLHDSTVGECQRCGDSEICAIVQSQKLHVKRAELEKKTEFKDIAKRKPKKKKKK